jgi:hypothetical protein
MCVQNALSELYLLLVRSIAFLVAYLAENAEYLAGFEGSGVLGDSAKNR